MQATPVRCDAERRVDSEVKVTPPATGTSSYYTLSSAGAGLTGVDADSVLLLWSDLSLYT